MTVAETKQMLWILLEKKRLPVRERRRAIKQFFETEGLREHDEATVRKFVEG